MRKLLLTHSEMHMSRRPAVAFLLVATLALSACQDAHAPSTELQSHVSDVIPAPSGLTVGQADGQITVRGVLQASCAPYGLNASAVAIRDTLVITLVGAVLGSRCPQDVSWTRGYSVSVNGALARPRGLRVLHTTDVPGATVEILYRGPLYQ